MKKFTLILLLLMLFLLNGCNFTQNEKIIDNKDLEQTIDTESPQDNSTEWLILSIAEGNGALVPNKLMIKISDVLNGENTIVQYKDILNYIEQKENIDTLSLADKMLDLSNEGTQLLLSRNYYYDPPEYKIIDLQTNEIYNVQREDNELKQLMYFNHKKEDEQLSWRFIEDLYPEFVLDISMSDYKDAFISSTLISPNKKDVVFTEKSDQGVYFVFYDIEENVEYERVLIEDINTDFLYLSQWHSNGEIYFNTNYYGYKYNIETKEITELGKYIYHPILSSDEKYLIYTKPDSYENINLLRQEDYGEKGIYLRILEDNIDIKIEILEEYELYEIYPLKTVDTKLDYTKYLKVEE